MSRLPWARATSTHTPVQHFERRQHNLPWHRCEQFFHGTKANLKTRDLIEPGHGARYGKLDRTTTYVCFTGTLDAATWGAELALGHGRGRIYVVESTGMIEDDPNRIGSFRVIRPSRIDLESRRRSSARS